MGKKKERTAPARGRHHAGGLVQKRGQAQGAAPPQITAYLLASGLQLASRQRLSRPRSTSPPHLIWVLEFFGSGLFLFFATVREHVFHEEVTSGLVGSGQVTAAGR